MKPPVNALIVVCHRFLNPEGKGYAIGGVETYVSALEGVAKIRGLRFIVLQRGFLPFDVTLDAGTRVKSWSSALELERDITAIIRTFNALVFYSDFHVCPKHIVSPSILLQHGIGWDYNVTRFRNPVIKVLNSIRKRIRRQLFFLKIRRIVQQVDRVLCVDTMFGNWLRTEFPFQDFSMKLTYIPNFADIPYSLENITEKWKDTRSITCIFPRRFAVIRGVRLFAEIVELLLQRYPNVHFTFIGDGECECEIKQRFSDCPRVSIYRRNYSEMSAEYLRAHIAVIPTLAAEGTSLSCIEAMASGCAVLSTSVGGLGNLVIPDYNGILCEPNTPSVMGGLTRLLDDLPRAQQMAMNGRHVVEDSFCRDVWQKRVVALIDEVTG